MAAVEAQRRRDPGPKQLALVPRRSGFASLRAGEPRSLRRGSCRRLLSLRKPHSPSSSPGRRRLARAAAAVVGRAQAPLPAALPAHGDGPRAGSGADRPRPPRRRGAALLPAAARTLDPKLLPRLAPLTPTRPRVAEARRSCPRSSGVDLARPALPRAPDRRRAVPGPESALDDLGPRPRPGPRSRLAALRQRQAHPPPALGRPGLPPGHPDAPRLVSATSAATAAGRSTSTSRTRTGSTSTSTTRALDRREVAPTSVEQVDVPLSRDLLNRFVAANAEFVFVGPHLPLHGPRGVVEPLVGARQPHARAHLPSEEAPALPCARARRSPFTASWARSRARTTRRSRRRSPSEAGVTVEPLRETPLAELPGVVAGPPALLFVCGLPYTRMRDARRAQSSRWRHRCPKTRTAPSTAPTCWSRRARR